MAITHSTHVAPTQEVALPSALARINSNVLETTRSSRSWSIPTSTTRCELWIEARALLRILRTLIVPVTVEDVCSDAGSGFQSPLFDEKRKLVEQLLSEIENLAEAFETFPDDDPGQAAESDPISLDTELA